MSSRRSNMRAPSNFLFLSVLRWFVKGASLLVLGVGLVIVLGWFFNVPTLKSILPSMPAIRFNTAFSLLLLGASLGFLQNEEADPSRKQIGKFLACLTLLISLLTLSEYLFRWDLGIDQLFV